MADYWSLTVPTYPLTLNNAWKAWTSGHVKGVNAYLDATQTDNQVKVQDTSTGKVFKFAVRHRSLGNLAIQQGSNAVRLWISDWSGGYPIAPEDWYNIAEAGKTAAAGSSGWASKKALQSDYSPAVSTIAALAGLITEVMDQCQQLGLGVILTGNYPVVMIDKQASSPWVAGSAARESLGLFWGEVVKKWGKHPALIGLDILNEPNPTIPAEGNIISAWRNSPNGWGTLAQDVINKVRAVEKAIKATTPVPIIVESPMGGVAQAMRMFDGFTPGVGGAPMVDPAGRVVYSFHHYSPNELTHQGVNDGDWANIGRVYGKTVARGIGGGLDMTYDSMNAFGEGWGRNKLLVKDQASLRAHWKPVIDFKNNAAAAGQPVVLYLGEFGYIHPEVDWVEPIDLKRSYLIDPDNGVPAYRVTGGSEQYKRPFYALTDRSGGWKKQHHSRWITRFEPFTVNGQAKVRLYFDNLDRLLFGRTWFPALSASELGSMVGQIEGTVDGPMFVDPTPPTPRPTVILDLICAKDPVTGLTNYSKIDRNKVPLQNRFTIGFPVSTKLAEADDARTDQNALEWDISKFSNTLMMSVVGPEGEIISNAQVTVRADQFWVEVNASDIKIAKYRQAVEIDPTLFEGKFPAKAVAAFRSATPNAEFEQGRDQFVADTLAICRELSMSWTFIDQANNYQGFIGWRASAAAMKIMKSDCES